VAVEGVLAPTGPVSRCANNCPDSNPVKKVGLEFRAAHLKANNRASTDAFSAYSFDRLAGCRRRESNAPRLLHARPRHDTRVSPRRCDDELIPPRNWWVRRRLQYYPER